MIEYKLLVYLWLLVIINVHSIEIQPETMDHFFIAPDISIDDNFVVVQHHEINSRIPRKLSIRLRIYNQQSQPFKGCSMNLTLRWGATKAGVNTMRRLAADNIVLAWYDEMLNGSDRRTRIVAMNDNCNRINPIRDNLPGDPTIVPLIGNKFDVIVEDQVTCQAVGKRCRISYNLSVNNVGRIWPFNVNLDWSTMQVNRLRNGDFLVRGYEASTYKILRVNRLTDTNETLIIQFEANPQPEFVSSDLSICGVVYPGCDNFTQCMQYNEANDTLIFQKRLIFDDPMTLIYLSDLGRGRMFLLVGKIRCNNEFDCWTLYGIEVRIHDDSYVRLNKSWDFHCTGDRKDLRIFDVTLTNNKISVRYACTNVDDFNYDIAYFDVDDERRY